MKVSGDHKEHAGLRGHVAEHRTCCCFPYHVELEDAAELSKLKDTQLEEVTEWWGFLQKSMWLPRVKVSKHHAPHHHMHPTMPLRVLSQYRPAPYRHPFSFYELTPCTPACLQPVQIQIKWKNKIDRIIDVSPTLSAILRRGHSKPVWSVCLDPSGTQVDAASLLRIMRAPSNSGMRSTLSCCWTFPKAIQTASIAFAQTVPEALSSVRLMT